MWLYCIYPVCVGHVYNTHFSVQQSSHHSSKPISGEPSDSTQSPSSSWSKNGGNESNYSSTQRKKRGGASNQGGGTLGRGSGTGEENGDGLPPDDHSKKNQDVAPQANKKKEPPVPLKQEQHLLQVRPSSISSETPPEAVRMKVSNQQVCSKPTPTSPVMPVTEVQTQNPSAVICDDAGGQPRLKPPINTQASPGAENFSQNPPIAIRNRVATEPRSYFNVKPPPDSQGAEASSEWDEPTTKTSASASILALRDPTVELNDESPPSGSRLPCTKVVQTRSVKILPAMWLFKWKSQRLKWLVCPLQPCQHVANIFLCSMTTTYSVFKKVSRTPNSIPFLSLH